jgi:hypothetical protein
LFTQTQLGRTYGPWNIDSIVYFREPSYRDDILPGLAPAQVALQSAQLGHYLERFASAFFEGGAQPVMVMNLPEAMDDAEFQRFRGEFATRIGGVANAFRSLFVRAPELKVQKVTPDINTMMLPELQERVITSIAMTLGVPRTMLEASAANYATADSDRQSFWRETIVPRLGMYEQILNSQLLAPIGYELRFNPEMLDVMQADEANRADSLLKLTQAGLSLPDAMRILGYDGVDEMFLAPPTPAPTAELPTEATPQEPSTPVGAVAPAQPDTATRAVDWALLAKKLERRIKAGKTPWCDFDSAVISAEEVKSVMARINEDSTVSDVVRIVAEVKAVDDLTPDERRIYNAIVPELAKRGKVWARQITQNKEVDPTLKDVIAPVLNAELATQMGKRIDTLGTQFSIPMDTGEESQRVTDWLSDYVPLTTSRIDQTTADRIKPIIETYRTTPGMTIDDVTAMLLPLSDAVRARMIAVTETTRAAAQATVEYQQYLGKAGITMIRVWNTDADEKVCPICTGEAYGVDLNGMTEDEWPAEVASGPPAHVNCRCDTSLRLVKEAPPVQPEVVQQPEVISRQSSVDALYDYAKSLLPENAQQNDQELNEVLSEIAAIRKELKALNKIQSPLANAKQNELSAAFVRFNTASTRKFGDDGNAARELLKIIQHENPQTVQITFTAKGFSKSEQARISELIRLTAGIAPDSGSPLQVNIVGLTANGGGAAWSGSGRTGKMQLSASNAPDIYVIHETLHALQYNYNYGIRATNEWAQARTAGESLKLMSTLDPDRYGNAPNNMVAYKDAVDDVQTLRSNENRMGGFKFPEVLTMPLTSLTQSTNGRDPDLLRLFLQIAKDDGK